jgi:hypothetical protein
MRWRQGVPQYSTVRQRNVYPGIDIIYHGDRRRLIYDVVVAPHADPSRVALIFDGAEGLALASDGSLIIVIGGSSVRHLAPVAYQEFEGQRQVVRSRFVLDGAGQVAFDVGDYDRTRPLVIDPTLVYATFAGGSGFDIASAIAVDAAGAVYIAGGTDSIDFAGANSTPSTVASGDVFVAKLNPQGMAFVYTTIVGGSNGDFATGIGVDAAGRVWVTGETVSSDFPMLDAIRPTIRGDFDSVLLRLDASGSLTYSTYLGVDFTNAIAVAPSGPAGATEVFITESTSSTDFPVVNALQPTFGGAGWGFLIRGDAFVMKLDANGNPLYATYLGGSDDDAGFGIAADPAGNAYVLGVTGSTDFPITSALQAARAGGDTYNYDLFIAKLNPSGSALVYSTYLGGSGMEEPGGIQVDSGGRAVIVGSTTSNDFPMMQPLQSANAGGQNAVVREADCGWFRARVLDVSRRE